MKRIATVTCWDVMGRVHVAVHIKGSLESHPNQVAEEWIDAHTLDADQDQVPEQWLQDVLVALCEYL